MKPNITISFDTAEQIAADFVRQQYEWLSEDVLTYENEEDINDAKIDLNAMRRLYNYMTGEQLP
jgi:hypothetical protein